MAAAIEGLSYARRKKVAPLIDATRNGKGALALYGLMYATQITLAYFCMLLAMTYAAWLVVAIVLGLTAGHLVFRDVKVPGEDGTCCPRDPEASSDEDVAAKRSLAPA